MKVLRWPLVLALAIGISTMRLVGMFVLRPKQAERIAPILTLVPVAVIAAVVVLQTVGSGPRVVIDARFWAVAVIGVAVWRKAPSVVMAPLAAIVCALVRRWGWAQ